MQTRAPIEHIINTELPVKGEIPADDLDKITYRTLPLTSRFFKQKSTQEIKFPSTVSVKDPHNNMYAAVYYGSKDIRVESVPRPLITDPGDAIIRITLSTICGSDLHFYNGAVPGMEKGDILGHECMGIVESVGSSCSKLKVGDRVVVSAVIADGTCFYCQSGLYSLCEVTNPSKEMEQLYGHRIAGVFGYSHLTGGYEGGQAEYIRVPYADFNCLKISKDLPDDKVLFLSDIVCTGWHANELGGVTEGCTVAIWGCGPVGLMAGMWAKFRKADKVIMIDDVEYRLKFAKEKLGVDTINFKEIDVKEAMDKLLPHGPDVCIDCVGFRGTKSVLHKVQKTLKLETDTPEVLNEAIRCVRKGGTISVIGDYFQSSNNFLIGALMEKGITMRGSQVFVQRYWKQLLGYIEQGLVDPTFLVTHKMPLREASEGYRMFDQKEDNAIKILLVPEYQSGVTGAK
jgi:threonine dehydrogenase-like Zn-dependent dehydrogenase